MDSTHVTSLTCETSVAPEIVTVARRAHCVRHDRYDRIQQSIVLGENAADRSGELRCFLNSFFHTNLRKYKVSDKDPQKWPVFVVEGQDFRKG